MVNESCQPAIMIGAAEPDSYARERPCNHAVAQRRVNADSAGNTQVE